ncbi:MAG: hypothetical protein WA174_04715, partial [Rhodoferax sp.]
MALDSSMWACCIGILCYVAIGGDSNCREVNAFLDEHIVHVAQCIRKRRQLEKQLKSLRETCVVAISAA